MDKVSCDFKVVQNGPIYGYQLLVGKWWMGDFDFGEFETGKIVNGWWVGIWNNFKVVQNGPIYRYKLMVGKLWMGDFDSEKSWNLGIN